MLCSGEDVGLLFFPLSGVIVGVTVGADVAFCVGVEVTFCGGVGVGVKVGVAVGVAAVVGVGVTNEPPVAVTVSALLHASDNKFMCIHGLTTVVVVFIYSL